MTAYFRPSHRNEIAPLICRAVRALCAVSVLGAGLGFPVEVSAPFTPPTSDSLCSSGYVVRSTDQTFVAPYASPCNLAMSPGAKPHLTWHHGGKSQPLAFKAKQSSNPSTWEPKTQLWRNNFDTKSENVFHWGQGSPCSHGACSGYSDACETRTNRAVHKRNRWNLLETNCNM